MFSTAKKWNWLRLQCCINSHSPDPRFYSIACAPTAARDCRLSYQKTSCMLAQVQSLDLRAHCATFMGSFFHRVHDIHAAPALLCRAQATSTANNGQMACRSIQSECLGTRSVLLAALPSPGGRPCPGGHRPVDGLAVAPFDFRPTSDKRALAYPCILVCTLPLFCLQAPPFSTTDLASPPHHESIRRTFRQGRSYHLQRVLVTA
jgi:hypothetical protein